MIFSHPGKLHTLTKLQTSKGLILACILLKIKVLQDLSKGYTFTSEVL